MVLKRILSRNIKKRKLKKLNQELMYISKNVLSKKELNKIFENDFSEIEINLKKMIKWKIEKRIHTLEEYIGLLKRSGKDVLYIWKDLINLKGKAAILFFYFNKQEFNKVEILFKKIKKELKNY